MTRICPSCGSVDWEKFLETSGGTILTGDQRITRGRISKVICSGCGVVANAAILSPEELQVLYGEAYQLNTSGTEEHLFFSKDGPLQRSQVIHDWIAAQLPAGARSLIEIGCGQGNLLARFKADGLQTMGFEGSAQAAELARAKGLTIINELILTPEQSVPVADVVMSYNVIEHVEDIDAFVQGLAAAVAPGGVLVFGLPVQDDGGYDLFFMEHVWHFTTQHVRMLLERRGLEVLHIDASHPVNRGAGLFVCRPRSADSEHQRKNMDRDGLAAVQIRNRDHWLDIFVRVDAAVAGLAGKRLAVYGSGEVLSLLMAYTDLKHASIVACIDEDPAKIGTRKHEIPVHGPNSLGEIDISAVLLTANPRYDEQIRAKLAPWRLEIVSCLAP